MPKKTAAKTVTKKNTHSVSLSFGKETVDEAFDGTRTIKCSLGPVSGSKRVKGVKGTLTGRVYVFGSGDKVTQFKLKKKTFKTKSFGFNYDVPLPKKAINPPKSGPAALVSLKTVYKNKKKVTRLNMSCGYRDED